MSFKASSVTIVCVTLSPCLQIAFSDATDHTLVKYLQNRITNLQKITT